MCRDTIDGAMDEVRMLPNGARIEITKLPSGKRFSRMVAKNGSLLEEKHFHGDANGKTAIGITLRFDGAQKTGEVYFHDGRLVSREVYERERVKYADMPAADASVVDRGIEGLTRLKEDMHRREDEAKRRAKLSPAKKIDRSCEEAMAKGEQQDLGEWLHTGGAITLGELDEKASAAAVNELLAAGAVRVVATNVGKDQDGLVYASWIVAEIPRQASSRRKLFPVFDRLATKDGWDPTPDVGQRYQILGKFKW
jgi:hypothetical protein